MAKKVPDEIKEIGEQFVRKLKVKAEAETTIAPSWAAKVKCTIESDGKQFPKGYIALVKPEVNLLPFDVIIEDLSFNKKYELTFINPLNHPITIKPNDIIGSLVLVKSI